MDSMLNFVGSMFQDTSSMYYLAGGAFLIVFLYLISKKLKAKPKPESGEAKAKKGEKSSLEAKLDKKAASEEMVVDKKMAKLAAKAAKEAQKKAEQEANREKKHRGKLFSFGRKKAAVEPTDNLVMPDPNAPPPPPIILPVSQPNAPIAKPSMAAVGYAPKIQANRSSATVLATQALPANDGVSLSTGNFKAVQLKAAQTGQAGQAGRSGRGSSGANLPSGHLPPLPKPPVAQAIPAVKKPSVPLPPPPGAPKPSDAHQIKPSSPGSTGVRIGSGNTAPAKPLPAKPAAPPKPIETPLVRPIGDSEPIEVPDLNGPGAQISVVPPIKASTAEDLADTRDLGPAPVLEEDPFVQTDQYSDQELPQAPDLGPSIDGPGYQEAQPIEPFSDPDSLEGPHLEEASLAPEADSGPPDLVAEIVPITTIEPSEEIPQIDQIEPQPTTLDIMLEATAAPEPPNLDVTTLDDDINQLDARPLEPKQPQGPPEPPEITATAVSDQDASDPRSATQVVAPRATPMTEPLKVKPMSVLEGRGGVLKASQTQMTTPIAIDQTQMPRVMKEAAASFQSPGQTVTIQDLDVNYQKNTFLNPLEVVYYKLLRSAFTQYLIFPKVTSRATVSISSRNSEHLKVAENVLTNTCISFVICDVKLNIKAVVELVEDGALPSNKDKARDYILKKAGCVLIRFYSADTPPDVSTLRRLLLD